MTAELEPVAGGPKTEGGKETARWNATRHGIRSPSPVVPGVEKARDWEDHRDGILENLSPAGHLELTLAERVALLIFVFVVRVQFLDDAQGGRGWLLVLCRPMA